MKKLMKKNLLGKVLSLIKSRPTQVWAYGRQTYLFYQTYFLRSFFLKNLSQYKLGNNVRIQALKTLTAESSALLAIGDNTVIYENARIESLGTGQLTIGDNSIIGDARITCRESIRIGRNFLTSWNVFIQDFDPHPVSGAKRAQQVDSMATSFYPAFQIKPNPIAFHFDFPSEPITIGDNVWLGANVTILKGAHIGDNCIVATGAVVIRGQYEANSILAGNPAKIVKTGI